MSALAFAASEPIPGYKLKKRIGAGGYGEVWEAETPGDLVKAVKFVFGFLDEERAARELKALTRIRAVRHPFLLSLERIEVVDGQLVIVTELADGSLKDRFEECKRQGAVGIGRDELLVYMRDAADALDYMSEHHSLQHLDVKPENLLLVGGRIKVADFGLVKDLHDGVSVSILGGLTPLYAPPELFDGRPSRHSDQYSLAVMYQEMLTGVMPFPGTTASQLATQHLNMRPRVNSLPRADQPIIAKALSKDPEQRYASCRVMVEGLCRAADSPAMPPAPKELPAPRKMLAATQAPEGARKSSAPALSISCTSPTSRPPSAPSARQEAATMFRPMAGIELDANGPRLRPTLFIGIGGTGGAVLTRLTGRVRDRLGDVAAFPFLLLDTDSRSLQQATADSPTAAASMQTVALPLRKPQDYRSDARALTQSTSRRWLYNIPRSLQTDGMRPLGRLAFADHAQEVCQRIHAAIKGMLAPEVLAKAAKAAGEELCAKAPRVVIVASISGGTGSGMVLELSYAVRKVLCELNLAQEICGVLVHSTPRNQSSRDLAIASAVSCLGELRQYQMSGTGYPGDTACGLPPFSHGTPTFDSTYLVHLGDQLGVEEFEQGAGQIADYLYLDSFTPTGHALYERRRREVPLVNDIGLRSFGMCPIGGVQPDFVAAAAEALAGQVARGWLEVEASPAGSGGSLNVETLASARLDELELGIDQITRAVAELALKEKSSELPQAKLDAIAKQRSADLVDWVLKLVNLPGVRVRGAQAAAAWLVTRLREFDERVRGTIEQIDRERAEIEALLAAAAASDKSKGKNRVVLGPAEVEERRRREVDLKRQAALFKGVRHVLQGICGKVVLSGERLRDLGRDVQFFGTQFQPPAGWDEPSADDEAQRDLARQTRETARKSFCDRFGEIAQRLSEQFHNGHLRDSGGLWELFGKPQAKEALPAVLRERARCAAKEALQAVDISAAILPSLKNLEWLLKQLQACLDSARPKLAGRDGVSRLMIVVPSSADHAKLAQFVEGRLGESPQMIAASGGDVVFCYETEGLSLQRLAATLADDRPDYVEAASRLHTRCDVSWDALLKA